MRRWTFAADCRAPMHASLLTRAASWLGIQRSMAMAKRRRMTNVCFAGVTGWTAPPIIKAIDEADDLTQTAGVPRSAAGRPLSEVTG